jgi:small subunit ribosomal protein S17
MAEEEKQEQQETPEESAEEQAAPGAETAEEAPAADAEANEEQDSEAGASEETPEAEETPGAEAADEALAEVPAADAADEEPEEALPPKQRRKRERSQAPAEARPPRSPEERVADRAERRRAAAVSRRRYRAARRAKLGEPAQGTPRPEREPGSQKVRQGTVVSAGADKTITVEIPVVRRHPTYEKVVRRTSKLHAHDESNQAQEGDVVRVIESRPLSRTKRWRLLDVLERAR